MLSAVKNNSWLGSPVPVLVMTVKQNKSLFLKIYFKKKTYQWKGLVESSQFMDSLIG